MHSWLVPVYSLPLTVVSGERCGINNSGAYEQHWSQLDNSAESAGAGCELGKLP